ncbi:site-specific DNA-methyltransferase [Campylobacter sp.]|uniref:site-specific DNA-methyltransferase n=1 Tax=Campylobacter sp. TaxID=205 RepID=UPI002A5F10CE|nr:site-specific DNA-methyltransferase [Campylobacter sp.]MDD7703694.1 site-specific DNA-methyltransferase [Campylobacteraceae bacterium]MDY2635414.1 site-specific DNA-methyltransferase [Campylobacter sp.]
MNKEEILISDIKEKFDTLGVARSLAISDDDRILDFLLKDSKYSQEYKERFFKEHSLALVFKKDDFLNFLDLKLLNSSYTSFSNKIGLGTKAKRFIKNDENVVLNFPFKDGVLKGGQSKDDEKSNEIFFNNVLAKSDIDALFSPKVLTNFELLGEGDIKEVLKNNPSLLIKGNNLIALHTLKEYFKNSPQQNKVKLIYIDPPYNTGNDDFKYNDKFKHSTWLCFMKNRLEIARELLRDDGVIFVQCDDNEQAYLKVLMDEIFGRENFVNCITCKVKSAGGLTTDTEMFFDCAEYLICYAKNSNYLTYNSIKIEIEIINSNSKTAKQYNKIITNIQYDKKEFVAKKDDITYYKIKKGDFEIKNLPIKEMNEQDFFNNRNEIFRLTALSGGIGKKLKNHIEDFTNNEDLFVFEYIPSKGKDKGILSQYLLYKGATITMLNKLVKIDERNKRLVKLEPISNIIIDDLWQGISNEGGIQFKNAKKPETLIQRIIEISTQKNDLVLDFFAGSGTTMAVAHKMKRRCITIEQMDYIQTITKERMKKVIDGEQGGISKAVSWSGGGNVVYCELAPLNAYFVEKIQNSRNEAELESIIASMSEKAFIDYRVDIKKVLEDKEFSALSLEDKKATLIDCLDRNMDYIPYADINDSEYKISDEAKKLNKIFYNKGE